MRPFTKLAAVVFALVAIVHLFRLTLGWEVLVAGIVIPMWMSALGFLVAAGLAALLLQEARK